MKKRHWAVKRPHGMVILREEGRNLASVHDRDNYTAADAADVVEWLNGHDQPLPFVNMQDWPGHAPLGRTPPDWNVTSALFRPIEEN
jgi:hypothetical protein